MDVVQGGGKPKIAGAKIGEVVWVHLSTGKVEKILLTDVTRIGIEGLEVDLKSQPLTFYPYANIIKVKKHTEIL